MRNGVISSSSDGRVRRRAIFPSLEAKASAADDSESEEEEEEADAEEEEEEEEEDAEEVSEGICTECTTSNATVMLKQQSLICLS